MLMAGQLLIVRVRLRDRSSALKGLAGLAGTSCVSPKGPSHAWASRPMIQHNRPTTARNNPSAQGGRGRTGVPAPESGEQTMSEGTVPNHDRGINTVKRVTTASGRALHRLAGAPCGRIPHVELIGPIAEAVF